MTCTKTHRLLYLHRPGEMTADETLLLENHLRECPACRAEHTRILAADTMLQAIRGTTPPAPHLDRAVSSILAAIPAGPHKRRRPQAAWWERALGAGESPAFRLAASLTLSLLLGTLFLQQLDLLRDVAQLERQQERRHSAGPIVEARFVIDPRAVSFSPDVQKVFDVLTRQAAVQSDGRLTAPVSVALHLRALADSGPLQPPGPLHVSELRRLFPAIGEYLGAARTQVFVLVPQKGDPQ